MTRSEIEKEIHAINLQVGMPPDQLTSRLMELVEKSPDNVLAARIRLLGAYLGSGDDAKAREQANYILAKKSAISFYELRIVMMHLTYGLQMHTEAVTLQQELLPSTKSVHYFERASCARAVLTAAAHSLAELGLPADPLVSKMLKGES